MGDSSGDPLEVYYNANNTWGGEMGGREGVGGAGQEGGRCGSCDFNASEQKGGQTMWEGVATAQVVG